MGWEDDYEYWINIGLDLQSELFMGDGSFLDLDERLDKEIEKYEYALDVITKILELSKTNTMYYSFLNQIKEQQKNIKNTNLEYARIRRECQDKEDKMNEAFFIAEAILKHNRVKGDKF